jgi:hypothetical protein
MAKGGRTQRKNWRPYLGVGDYLNAENIGKPWAAIVSKSPKDQVLALLVKDKNA